MPKRGSTETFVAAVTQFRQSFLLMDLKAPTEMKIDQESFRSMVAVMKADMESNRYRMPWGMRQSGDDSILIIGIKISPILR